MGLIVFLANCKRSENPLSWDSDYTLPLVHGSLGVSDLIPDSLLSVAPDSTVMLVYEGSLLEVDMTEILMMPDTIIVDTFQVPFPSTVNLSPGQVFINIPDEQDLNLPGVYLSNAKIHSGVLAYEIESTVAGKVTYTYEIPSAQDWMGNIFSKSVTVPAASGGGTSTVSGTFDLDGYYLDLTGQNGLDLNVVLTNINCKIAESNTSDVSVSSADNIIVSNNFQEITIEEAEGYFGQHSISSGLEYASFEGFKKWVSGAIDIDDLDVDIVIKNGVGVDLFLQLNELTATGNSSSVSLNNAMIGDLITLARPTRYYDSIIATTYSNHLDPTNSNVDNFLETMPTEIGYNVDVEINPLGNVSGYNDFYYMDSPLGIYLNASMPLSLIASDLTLQDTLSFSVDDAIGLNELLLYIDVDNGFPIEADIELGILDVNDKLMSRVFSPTLIESATTDVNGKVTESTSSQHEILLSSKDLERLRDNGKVLLTVQFNTPGNQHVTLYDSYRLEYKVKADANITISTSNED